MHTTSLYPQPHALNCGYIRLSEAWAAHACGQRQLRIGQSQPVCFGDFLNLRGFSYLTDESYLVETSHCVGFDASIDRANQKSKFYIVFFLAETRGRCVGVNDFGLTQGHLLEIWQPYFENVAAIFSRFGVGLENLKAAISRTDVGHQLYRRPTCTIKMLAFCPTDVSHRVY